MKKSFKTINWQRYLHSIVIFLLFLYINFSLVSPQILRGENAHNIQKAFQNFQTFGNILYGLAIVVLALYMSRSIKIKSLLKYITAYLIYLVISYFLLVTRNLNNGNFKLWDLENNGFFQYSSLTPLIFILVLAVVFKLISDKLFESYKTKFKHTKVEDELLSFDKFFQSYDSFQLPVALFWGTVILSDRLTIPVLKGAIDSLIKADEVSPYIWTLTINILVCLALYSLLCYFIIQGIYDLILKKASIPLAVSTSFLLALIFNYTLQAGVKVDRAILGRYIFPGASLYQILFLALVNVVFYMIINRYLITTTILIVLGSLLTIANNIKFSMRNEPVLFSDLSWLKSLDMLLSYVDIKVIIFAIIGFVFLASVTYLLWKVLTFQDQIHEDWRFRIAVSLPIVILFTIVIAIFRQQDDGQLPNGIPILSKLNNTEKLEWMGQSVVARERSLMFVWTKQLTSVTMEEPSDYNKEAMTKVVKKYSQKADSINKTRKNKITDQTVIFVLSESFADPARLSHTTLNQDPIPYINAVKSVYTSGLMKADSYGGGTANMEFQSLTGLPMYNLSPSISTIYTEVVPKMKRVPSISDSYASKDKFTVHLGNADTYSRKSVYRELGFNDFVAAEGGNKASKHLGKLGVYPSDANTYQTVLDNIDESRSQFISVITYQNHTPWYYTNGRPYGGTGEGFSKTENTFLNSYIKLINQTDDATQAWLNKLSKLQKKVTVVFYGDHLPGFYPEKTFKDKPETQYQTDYFIWSNYPTTKQNHPYVNSSDFPAELLAETSSKVSPYQALLTEVLNNASVDKKRMTKDQKKIAHDLKLVEYDLVSGKGYIASNEKFFKVSGGK